MRINLEDNAIIQILDNFKQTFLNCNGVLEENPDNDQAKLLLTVQMEAAKQFCNQITIAAQEGASWNEDHERFVSVKDMINDYYAENPITDS